MQREPAPAVVEEIERVYRASRFLDAQGLLDGYAAPEEWHSTRARVIAARTLGNVGARDRARRLTLATWRRDPADPAARYYLVLDYLERHGPLETLRLLDDFSRSDPTLATPAQDAAQPTAWLWLLRARCLSLCRDFEAAAEWLAAGERAQPNEAWTFVERAMCLEHADRYDEAVAAAEQALALRPGYARAAWQLAHLLVLVRRDADALDLLRRETNEGQSGHLALQLGSLLSESGQWPEALQAYGLAAQRFPRADKALDQLLSFRRADLLHRLGRDGEAVELARGLKGRYGENFFARLSTPSPGVRVQLPVPFVRQHHVTCAPATLAAVSAYLGAPIDHQELARAITYDGTPDHEERHWLETHGWAVREFRVTWDTAVALIAANLPFTLVTTWTGSAHLQAVIGYDSRLGTLIIRDPYQRESHEALASELLEQQSPYGPRGMVFVPAGEAARIRDFELPEADAYDQWFRLRRCLLIHDRPAAAAAAEQLASRSPGGRLALWAERQLAYYDDNPARALTAVTALRAMFPDDANLQIEELSLLSRAGRRAEHRERIAAAMRSGKADPAIWREQVEIWRADARHHDRALRLARRFARARPFDWTARTSLADVLWDRGEFAEAVKLYRLAAAGADKTEEAWRAYFAAARHVGAGAAALALLQSRQERLGDRSSEPAITLSRALEQLDRTPAIPGVLENALTRRPDDGDLLVELALVFGRTGEREKAEHSLAAARPRIAPAIWHRVAARLAAWRGDHRDALQHVEAVLAGNPRDVPMLGEAARLVATTAGPAAALDWLAACVARHPHFLPLRQLRLEWLRERPVGEALAEVQEFLQLEPGHAWALREQALILLRAQRAPEALASARLAEEIEPRVPQSPGVVGQVLLVQRDHAAARAATERALKIDIGADWLMPQLLSAAPEFSQRLAAVAFIQDELEHQPAPVTGYLRFRDVAVGVLAPEKLQEALEALRAGRAERWEPWSACIQQAIAMSQSDRAQKVAAEAAEKFPLVPRAWLDLADAHRLAGAVEGEEAALIRARELAPGWRDAALRLASLYQRTLRPADGERVLAATLAHDPLDARVRFALAESCWRTGRGADAIAAAEQTLIAAPGWADVWTRLADWCAEHGEPARVVEFARQLATQRPGDAQARRQVAHVLAHGGDNAAALEEVNAAVRLNPLDLDSHDLRAFLLARLGRRDEAIAACSPAEYQEQPPHPLRGRAAWIRWLFGERRAAIDALTAVTAAHPDYAWGWQQLAEWHEAMGENHRAAAAAQKYAELCPDEPAPWGWLAALKIKAAEHLGALPFLERALRLDPSYRYAVLRIAAEFSRWPEAERALTLIRQHASKWHALRCDVLYHRYRHDKPAAFTALAQLAAVPSTETTELLGAVEHLSDAGWLREIERPLREVLTRPDVNPEAGAIWMRARLTNTALWQSRIRFLERSDVTDAVRRAGWRVYLEWLAGQRKTLTIRWHLGRRGEWLARDDVSWGTVSYVLANLQWNRRLVRWMNDWPVRKDVQPWMLSNLAHGLIALDRWAGMPDLVAAALRMPADQTRSSFVAWAARLAAKSGHYQQARELLAAFENVDDNAFAALFAEQTRVVVDVATAGAEAQRTRFAEARARLAEAVRRSPAVAAVPYMARENRRALRDAARLARSPWRWWYALPSARAHLPTSRLAAVGTILLVLVLLALMGVGAPAGTVFVAVVLGRLISSGLQRR